MSAHTVVTAVDTAIYGGEGVKQVSGTFTGSASYDTGGSIIDLSSYFSDEVRSLICTCQGLTKTDGTFIPGASNGAALGKIAMWDKDGTQEGSTDNLSTITFDFIATGTDA